MDIQTRLSPERVVAALTDFSERRPSVWKYLDPAIFEVYEVGDTSAFVREGTGGPLRVWAKERYDWSTPGVVRWTVEESDSFLPGYGLRVDVAPGSDGGSKVHIVWERVGKNLKGKLIVAIIALLGGKPIGSSYKQAFDALADA